MMFLRKNHLGKNRQAMAELGEQTAKREMKNDTNKRFYLGKTWATIR